MTVMELTKRLSICTMGMLISCVICIPIVNIFSGNYIFNFRNDSYLSYIYFFVAWNMYSGLILFTFICPFIYSKNLRSILFRVFIYAQFIVFLIFVFGELEVALRTLLIALPNILAVGYVLRR